MTPPLVGRRFFGALSAGCVLIIFASSAQANFHLWKVQELYTNLNGTVQFIELATPSGSQNFTGSTTIQVVQQGTGTTHTFTIPSNLNTSVDTTGRMFLVGTAGLQAAGGPTPDFTMPNGFLFASGGTITYQGTIQGTVSYTALPTDGVTSHAVPGNTSQVNSPTNFSNQTGAVPEPTTWGLIGLCGLGLCILMRRRSSTEA